ncbi:zinc finger protein 385B isoform X2 [Neltuma alba]|uniref:zinc finger protein 385B isoform X2 n=1 Tax=Neltuma alba TaxID=207710 RepID=UPI0010A520C8|nr:zinc finger protein 385B-like isoform X2 [Prosopis alba]
MHYQPHTFLSSDEVLLSLPQPSLAHSLFPNSSADAGCTTDPLDSVSNVQKLIVHQVRPIRYGPAVETSQGTFDIPTVFHSSWWDSWVRQINQTKTNNPLRCEVCKIDLNSKSVFEDHISGKTHKKSIQLHNNPNNTISSGTANVTFQIQESGVQGQELLVDADKDLKSKKQKFLIMGEAELADQAVKTSQGTSDMLTIFHNLWRDNWVRQINQTKINKRMRCEVCKIDLNSKSVFEDHISGKKHKKNMQLHTNPSNTVSSAIANMNFQIQNSGVQGQEPLFDADKDLKSKKRKLLIMGEAELADQAMDPTNEPLEKLDTSKQELINSHKPEIAFMLEAPEKDVETKKQKCELEFPSRCEICSIDCNSKKVYISHLSGKKHQRNLEKVSQSEDNRAIASVASAAAATMTEIDVQQATKQAIEPQEKLETSPQEGMDTHESGNIVIFEAPEKDTETERLRIEPFGGAAITFSIVCELCNAACNSETVFNSHLHGKKHAAMAKKLTMSK